MKDKIISLRISEDDLEMIDNILYKGLHCKEIKINRSEFIVDLLRAIVNPNKLKYPICDGRKRNNLTYFLNEYDLKEITEIFLNNEITNDVLKNANYRVFKS